jgi:hypothetical protein
MTPYLIKETPPMTTATLDPQAAPITSAADATHAVSALNVLALADMLRSDPDLRHRFRSGTHEQRRELTAGMIAAVPDHLPVLAATRPEAVDAALSPAVAY